MAVHLVETNDLAKKLALPDTPTLLSTLEEVSARVTNYLITLLDTELVRNTVVDTFVIDTESELIARPYVQFFLKQGFVDSGQAFEVRVGPDRLNIATADVVDAQDYEVDWEKGILKMFDGWKNKYYAQVSYTAGYTVGGDILTDPPSWLMDASSRYVDSILINLNRKDADKRAEEAPRDVMMLLLHRIRDRHYMHTPYKSVVTPV